MESGQFLERFRILSRDMQNELQSSKKNIDQCISEFDNNLIKKVSNSLSVITESWQDFCGWVLISTLDDMEEAKANCASGIVDLRSKVVRAKIKREKDTQRRSIKVITNDVECIAIETYIPYFEQLLDLILDNAIKYSYKGSEIEISTGRKEKTIQLVFQSYGPLMHKHELERLGQKGFRGENAYKTDVCGQGYGIYNMQRIALLIDAKVSFNSSQKTAMELSGVPYSAFTVTLVLPLEQKPKNAG